jgi:4-amino-4-deoxy-L-arabinose transferase-like glycosyltransferase
VRQKRLVTLVVALAVAGLLWGGKGGALWEPHELEVAELSRRIALNLLGGGQLFVPGAENSLPIRADLGRGELPFTSAALGFRLFGLHDWAGRLPLLLWSLLGLGSVYLALARLWDGRAALYAVLILATTPLYFLQARTLLGDAVTLASFAMAWSGLSVALLAGDQSTRARVGFALLGGIGLYAGFWCRGPIVSVAVPAGAVGMAALLGAGALGRLPRALALSTLVLAGAALALGWWALAQQRETGQYSLWVGSAVTASQALPTFEVPLGALAHACFPWSALAPLALSLPWAASRAAPAEAAPVAAAAAVSLGASLAATAWLAPWLGAQPLTGVIGFSVLAAGALRELERGASHLQTLALLVAGLAIVIGFDLRVYPDKAMAGFGLAEATMPEALQPVASKLWTASALALAVAVLFCLYEASAERGREGVTSRQFERAEYVRVLRTLQQVWDGNLVFALVVLEAALVGFLLLSAISERLVPLPQLDSFGSFWRTTIAYGAVAVPLLPLVPLGAMVLRDLSRLVFAGPSERASGRRAQGVLLVGLAIGATTSFWFYPALARQVAPKEVFERFAELRRPGEPLGRLGGREGESNYQGGLGSVALADVPEAFAWLSAAGSAGPRRWLLLGKEQLPQLNAAFRERDLGNVPILDARSSEVLLATNRLARHEQDQNPLSRLVLDRAPPPQNPVRAVLGERKLEVLGWSVTTARGELVTRLKPATRYRFIIYWRVLGAIDGDWQAFLHIDGLQRRFNADHEPLEGKYPLSLWREGDVMADSTDVVLEPTFGPGRYSVYFGLFSGERRLQVSEGPKADDRIVAGTIEID